MNLINLQTLQYPVSIYTIRAANPNTSYPDNSNFVPEGYAAVNPTPFPAYDKNTQKVIELDPIQDGDSWQQAWEVVELSVEEKQKIFKENAHRVRNQRDALLSRSDWTQLGDVTLSNKEDWNSLLKVIVSLTLSV
jgi:hypothetical protein